MYFAAVVLTASIATGQTNESPSGTNPLEEASWLIGTWEAEYDLPSGVPELGKGGEKVKENVSWQWALDRRFIVFRSRTEIEGQPTFSTLEVSGVDPKSGRVTCSLFNSTGAQGHGEWQKEGDTLILKWAGVQPDQTVYKGMSYIRQKDKDEYTWGMENVSRDGERIPDWGPVTYRRSSGHETTRNDFDEYCQAMQGRWVNDNEQLVEMLWPGSGDPNKKVTSYCVVKIVADGNAIEGAWQAGERTGKWMEAWDAESEQVKKFGVMSDGTTWNEVRRKKGENWECAVTLTRPNGQSESFSSILTWGDGGNTHSYKNDVEGDLGVYRRVGQK